MQRGDRFVLYTDGLIECTNAQGKPWGSKRFERTLGALSMLTSTELKLALVNQARLFYGETEPIDDIAVVALDDQAAPEQRRQVEPSLQQIRFQAFAR